VYDPFHITQEQWKQRANVITSFMLFVQRVDLFCSLLECGRVDHDKCEQFCAQWLEDEKVSYGRHETDPGAPKVIEQFAKLRESANLFENLARLNGTPFDLDAKIRRHLHARGLSNEQIMVMSAEQICATLQTIDPIKPQALQVLKTTSAFLETLVPPDYIIDGVVQRGFLYSLCGKEGAGKTAILLLIAAHILLGRALGKKTVVRGRVLYLAGENPTEVKMRWQALCLELGVDESELDMIWVEGSKEKISKLLPKIHADCRSMGLEFTLVIVDTKQAYFESDKGEDDNNAAVADAQRHRQLTELPGHPAVIVSCHPPKHASQDDGLVPRGGGGYVGEIDGNLTCALEGIVATLHWFRKFRGPEFAPIAFIIETRRFDHPKLKDAKGRILPVPVASYLTAEGEATIVKASADRERALLQLIFDEPTLSLSEMAGKLGWTYKSGEANKSLVDRTIRKLEKDKLVARAGTQWMLTPKGLKYLMGAEPKPEPEPKEPRPKPSPDILDSIEKPELDAVCARCKRPASKARPLIVRFHVAERDHRVPLHDGCAKKYFDARADRRAEAQAKEAAQPKNGPTGAWAVELDESLRQAGINPEPTGKDDS
jgi:hypothetical protein